MLAQEPDQPGDREAHDGPARAGEHEPPAGLEPRDGPAADGRDRDPVGDQRGRVVEQALPFQDRHDAVGQAHPTGHGGSGDRIRRRNDRSQRDPDRPRGPGHHGVEDHGHDHRGEQDEPDRQKSDRAPVGPEGGQRSVDGRGEQQRREDEDQHDLGVERESGEPRHERQDDAGQNQQDRLGQLPAPRGHPHHRDEQHELEQAQELVHACIVASLVRYGHPGPTAFLRVNRSARTGEHLAQISSGGCGPQQGDQRCRCVTTSAQPFSACFDEIINGGWIGLTDELVSPDFTSNTPQGPLDREGFKQ